METRSKVPAVSSVAKANPPQAPRNVGGGHGDARDHAHGPTRGHAAGFKSLPNSESAVEQQLLARKVSSSNEVEEDEIEELEQELETLHADQVFVKFLEDITLQKIPAEADEEVGLDPDYVPSIEEKHDEEDRGDAEGEGGEGDDESTETETDDGAEDQLDGAVGASGLLADVQVPKQMRVEADKRYPPFWRMKYQFESVETSSYRSEDDPTYVPPEGEELGSLVGSSSDEDDFSSAKDELEMEGVEDELSGMIADLNIVEVKEQAAELEEVEASVEVPKAIGHVFQEIEEEGYLSEDDPDYVPPGNALMENDTASNSSSACDEAESEVQDMEQ